MGRIHDENVKMLNGLYGVDDSAYKGIGLNKEIIRSLNQKNKGSRVFFDGGIPEEYVDRTIEAEMFTSFEEAYHQLIMDLVDLTEESIDLIIAKNDQTRDMYISGGFAKNPIFLTLMASRFPDKKVYTSEVANATSLGAAMVLWKAVEPGFSPVFDLGHGEA